MNSSASTESRNPYLRADSLRELLSWDDVDFVRCAYVTVLGRQPDAEGEAYYAERIRRGHSKMQVLWQIRRSAEGRRHDPGIAGFDRALKQARWARNPILGPFARRLFQTEGDSLAERRHRVVVNELVRAQLANMRVAEEVARALQAGAASPVQPVQDAAPVEPAPVATARQESKLNATANQEQISLAPLAEGARLAGARSNDKCIVYSVGHTSACPVNTGVQRVTRQLARAFMENSERLLFVKWNSANREFELLSKAGLEHLSKWNGPSLKEVFGYDRYPESDEEPVFLKDVDWVDSEWMFFPEVHHLGTQDHEITISQVNAARALRLKTATVFYDAIPLRRPELKAMGELHESYMRQLMEVDVIFPISKAAGSDLELFLQFYEGVDPGRLPLIKPLLLPAEVPEKKRGRKSRSHRQQVLCVGSIDERKNQLLLAEVFAELATEKQLNGWKLKFVGNCSPDLHPKLSKIIETCDAIQWLGPVSDEKLNALYDEVAFCAFPSTDEGYGLPIAESLWMGKPCLCANFGSMAEIAEAGGCLTVDTSKVSSLKEGLQQLILEPEVLERLGSEVSSAKLGTWRDYAAAVRGHMDEVALGAERLGPIYYVAEQTAEFPGNTGIQRVTRSLASALLEIGVPLIPAKWDSKKSGLQPLTAEELEHLQKFNGPRVGDWASWKDPEPSPRTGWVIMPEITPHFSLADYDKVRSFLDGANLRGASIFYDTIPWKLRDFYSEGAAIAHANYMRGINRFDLILAISDHSASSLKDFYLSEPDPTVDLAHRISSCLLPGEFEERKRIEEPRRNEEGQVRILSVGTIEARKNHITLVKAFLKAQPQFNREARLVLAGSAPFADVFDPIRELIETSNAIEWVDRPTDGELGRLYGECDFTVYPSVAEGFGLPIVESTWHGKPCITADFGSMREAAIGGGCLLVDSRSVDSIAAALVRLVNSEPLRVALASEACAREVKSWNDYAREILGRIIDDTPPPAALPARRRSRASAKLRRAFANLEARPLLSVCITTYNRGSWLKQSLRALLQACAGFEDCVEVVVCDNTSTDETPEVMSGFSGNDLVRYHRNDRNVGMLGNLLVTSQKARGDYVWIVGDDDIVTPTAVATVVKSLKDTPGVAIAYLNYAYTRDEDPSKAEDLEAFFETATPIADGGKDFVAQVSDVSVKNENFFTAIYCVVLRRDHALRAYGQYTGGEPFSSLPTCVPTTNYILKNVMQEKAVWLAEPQIVVNLNVSWMKYAWRWILERFPEIHDTAVRYGADAAEVDKWRAHHLPSMVHFVKDVFGSTEGARAEFDMRRFLLDIKHLEQFGAFRTDFRKVYEAAVAEKHPAAIYDPDELFAAQ